MKSNKWELLLLQIGRLMLDKKYRVRGKNKYRLLIKIFIKYKTLVYQLVFIL